MYICVVCTEICMLYISFEPGDTPLQPTTTDQLIKPVQQDKPDKPGIDMYVDISLSIPKRSYLHFFTGTCVIYYVMLYYAYQNFVLCSLEHPRLKRFGGKGPISSDKDSGMYVAT